MGYLENHQSANPHKAKLNTRHLQSWKRSHSDRPQVFQSNQSRPLSMLTCYDFQTAQMMNESDVDMILVGDSLGNVVLGFDTTISVNLEAMELFGRAVRKGAPDKFLILDMPFGTYATFEDGVKNALRLFQNTGAEAVKLEGAAPHILEIIKRLSDCGVPVIGHIGLTPQSVHGLGGHYTHGKDEANRLRLIKEAQELVENGIVALVLECVTKEVAKQISEQLPIPTIGIGAGPHTDGQVLVINDLFHMGPGKLPKFVKPIADFYQQKKNLLADYHQHLQREWQESRSDNSSRYDQ